MSCSALSESTLSTRGSGISFLHSVSRRRGRAGVHSDGPSQPSPILSRDTNWDEVPQMKSYSVSPSCTRTCPPTGSPSSALSSPSGSRHSGAGDSTSYITTPLTSSLTTRPLSRTRPSRASPTAWTSRIAGTSRWLVDVDASRTSHALKCTTTHTCCTRVLLPTATPSSRADSQAQVL